jgi:hypothetical protein
MILNISCGVYDTGSSREIMLSDAGMMTGSKLMVMLKNRMYPMVIRINVFALLIL